jgi:hypothetical protein
MKRLIFILVGVLLLLLPLASTTDAVGIQPLEINITAKPGAVVPFKIQLKSTDKRAKIINFSLARPTQRLDGGFEFKSADPGAFLELKWISFDTSSVTIPQGGEREIIGKVNIPRNAKGSHMFTIMAEQPPVEKTGALLLSVIYAIKLTVNVDAPVPRLTAQISDFAMVKGPKAEPCIQFKVNNTSPMEYSTNASIIIRNSQTKKLIEKVQLKPKVYMKKNYDPVVLPDATVLFSGFPKEALLPGKYDMQLFFRYAISGQILQTKTVEIKPGDYIYPAAKLRIIRVDPNDISLTAKPGTSAMKGIKFENRSDKSIKIRLKLKDINTDYPYSILKNISIEFKNGQEFTIGPGRMAVAVLSARFPKEASIQGNYGLLEMTAFAADGNDSNPIEEFDLNLEGVTLGKYILRAEATDLIAVHDGQKLLFSAVIKNTGNIKITPKSIVYLKNSVGKPIDTIQLETPNNNDPVLPGKLITLTGTTNEKLAPGKYKAEFKIIQENEEIGKTVLDVQVN